ncbi:hypothetical protein QIH14_27295, partial [Klebsiella pneumoniae]|nr:hypothetical protein [Klebsiella pneumoniae]
FYVLELRLFSSGVIMKRIMLAVFVICGALSLSGCILPPGGPGGGHGGGPGGGFSHGPGLR